MQKNSHNTHLYHITLLWHSVKVEVKGSGNYQHYSDKNASTRGVKFKTFIKAAAAAWLGFKSSQVVRKSLIIQRKLTPLVHFSLKCGCCPAFVTVNFMRM